MKLKITKYSALIAIFSFALSAPLLPLCAQTQSDPDAKAAMAKAAMAKASMATAEKLKTIIVPKVDFEQTPLKEALTFLQEQSRLHDPEKKGVNFIVRDPSVLDKPITLKLTNISLMTALQYACSLSSLRFTIKKHTVVLKPAKAKGK
jgi:hypothetical protein